MTYDEHLFAMPKLYGAPAYARPPRPLVDDSPRPPDPDDLPLEAFRDDLEAFRDDVEDPGSTPLAAKPGNGAAHDPEVVGPASLQARPFSLRSLGRPSTVAEPYGVVSPGASGGDTGSPTARPPQ